MSSTRIGVYPGTFDPITNGHMDVILRAGRIVDRLVIGVAQNAGKGPLFSTEERLEIVLVTDLGQVIRCPVKDIRIAGRGTAGVMVFRVGAEEKVVSVATLRENEENGGETEEGEASPTPDSPPSDEGGAPPDGTIH